MALEEVARQVLIHALQIEQRQFLSGGIGPLGHPQLRMRKQRWAPSTVTGPAREVLVVLLAFAIEGLLQAGQAGQALGVADPTIQGAVFAR